MREGVNPEKYKEEKNERKFHRIIMPVFIPETTEDYYTESIEVFKSCVSSLFKTINYHSTVITIINNNSSPKVTAEIKKYLSEGLIDKHVHFQENRGKVYAVLGEARASYEPFITIADADVLFFSGWEKSIFEIYRNFPKAGVVSPLPLQNLAFNKNYSVFFDNYLLNKIKYDKVVSDEDCDLFLKGMGNTALLRRINRIHSWKERQYFLKNEIAAVVGAGHFVATYRKEIFENKSSFPEWKFKNGFEDSFLDEPADKLGWYRLSTVQSYAYHIGNKIDNVVRQHVFEEGRQVDTALISELKAPCRSKAPYWIKKIYFRALKKVMKL